MTHSELRQAAIDFLAKTFTDRKGDAPVIQAAVTIVLSPEPKQG